jgi:hypothetical protein
MLARSIGRVDRHVEEVEDRARVDRRVPAAEEEHGRQRGQDEHATYSAKKKKPKRMPLYSVAKPATISLSASVRSNGVRLPRRSRR